MTHRLRAACTAAILAAALAACATTKLEGSWTSATFRGQFLTGTVLVAGVARDETVRRIYEDAMTAELTSRGVSAMRSYEAVAGAIDAGTGEAIMAVARAQGVRYVLSTAVIARGTKTVVYNEPGSHLGLAGYGGWYGTYWAASFPVRSTVREYDVYSAETSITDVSADRLEWTARTKSTPGSDIEEDVGDFVAVIVAAMEKAGFVPRR